MDRLPPPYPRLGELYSVLAGALDTKARDRTVDRLGREGDYDWSRVSALREELITGPIRGTTDDAFAEAVGRFIDRMHASYLELVATVPLDSLNRNEALPLLVEHYFTHQGARLLLDIKDEFGGPDLMVLLDTEKHPLAVVFGWLDHDTGVDLVRAAFPVSRGADRSDRELIARWKNGTQTPDLQSIKRLAGVIRERAGEVAKPQVPNMRRWVLVARALAWLEKESLLPIRSLMSRHLLTGFPGSDIRRLLATANQHGGDRFSALKMPAFLLYKDLNRATPKAAGDQARVRERLAQFEQLATATDPEGRTRFHVAWLFGKWHVLSGLYEEALAYYEEASELAYYRAGPQQKQIIAEALVLAAWVGSRRSLLKRLKHRALVFGLFAAPSGGDLIEDWEVDQWRQHFHRLFPPQGRFPEATDIARAPMPFLMVNEENLARLPADLRNPDRVRSVLAAGDRKFRKPQLHLFASTGQSEAVRALLEHGASVDQLDDSNGSALLCAIQRLSNTGDRGPVDLILDRPHAKATLDSVTTKKRHTLLICAVGSGYPDIVERLLAMGATADQRGQITNITPLYSCLENLGRLSAPQPRQQSVPRDHQRVQHEQMRRNDVPYAGVFGDEQALRQILDDPRHRRIHDEVIAAMAQVTLERLSEPKMLRMVDLLLKGEANPNAVHEYPTPGRTPMMLAAEIDAVDAFALMHAHGGNPYQKDDQGLDCARLALGFSSARVAGYLRTRGIL